MRDDDESPILFYRSVGWNVMCFFVCDPTIKAGCLLSFSYEYLQPTFYFWHIQFFVSLHLYSFERPCYQTNEQTTNETNEWKKRGSSQKRISKKIDFTSFEYSKCMPENRNIVIEENCTKWGQRKHFKIRHEFYICVYVCMIPF